MANNPYYRDVKFFDALRRQSNPNWALAQRSKELNETLSGLLGTAQPAGQNAEGGGLFRSFTHDERDDRIRKISGQENPSYLKAVQDARTDNPLGDVFGEVGQGTPPGAAPVNLSERWQKIQEMLKSGDPLLQKAAMEQVPKELLPDAVAPKDLSKTSTHWADIPGTNNQQAFSVKYDPAGNITSVTPIPGMIQKKSDGVNVNVNTGQPPAPDQEQLDNYFGATFAAREYDRLLTQMSTPEGLKAFEQSGGWEGWFKTKWREASNKQNALDVMKMENRAAVNAKIVSSLPKGPASDHDIQIFAKGFPSEFAGAEVMKAFLRGAHKVERLKVLRSRLEEAHKTALFQGNAPSNEQFLIDSERALTAEWERLNSDPKHRDPMIDKKGGFKDQGGVEILQRVPTSQLEVGQGVVYNGELIVRVGKGSNDFEVRPMP